MLWGIVAALVERNVLARIMANVLKCIVIRSWSTRALWLVDASSRCLALGKV